MYEDFQVKVSLRMFLSTRRLSNWLLQFFCCSFVLICVHFVLIWLHIAEHADRHFDLKDPRIRHTCTFGTQFLDEKVHLIHG